MAVAVTGAVTGAWRPVCAICIVVLGSRAAPASTLIAGDAICIDHARLRVDCESLRVAVREARADFDAVRLGSPR